MTEKIKQFENNLRDSLHYGFINIDYLKNGIYAPELVLNKPEQGQFVLNELQTQLEKCQSFMFSVAFVSLAGIAMLKSHLSDLADKQVKGKLLISPYLGFNDPNAMRDLLKLRNVEVRLTPDNKNMHAKCYLFDHGLEQVALIGSSNLTETALKINYEWNIKLSSADNGKFIKQTRKEFEDLWEISTPLTESIIDNYAKSRMMTLPNPARHKIEEDLLQYTTNIQPNAMQKAALEGLNLTRQDGAKRALVISATGTGKTYLSAFDVKQYNPDRFLFIVHREQILRKAQADYQKILNFDMTQSAIYKTGMDLTNKKYIFTTIQTLSKDNNLESFSKDYFDYILEDEVHKAGASTYQKVINYFEPHFLLGMTATPERTDDFNIYELFDYNIAYEIRLQDALDEEMLCPFMYYGVKDLIVDEVSIDELTDFNHLVSDQRIDHILEKIEYYSVTGQKQRGLIFCSSKRETKELSEKLNNRGLKTVPLTGEDSQEYRQETVEKLESGDIDYILTVDIFNEGIDIPSVNQVIMLRNTQSSIVFIQQLGRGLRKHDSKQFVTILDFIGNYKNNYLIPIALFGDQSLNKDNVRNKLVNRNQIQGISTINFEEVARQQIFDSITNTSLSSMAILREKYLDLKFKLGRIPKLADFIHNNHLDPLVFFEGSFKHYGQVINKFEKDTTHHIYTNDAMDKYLSLLTLELLNGKRLTEVCIIDQLLKHGIVGQNQLFQAASNSKTSSDKDTIKSAIRLLNLEFFQSAALKRYLPIVEGSWEKGLTFTAGFDKCLNSLDFHNLVQDILTTAKLRSKQYPQRPLTIGQKYSRKDACRLLNWPKDETSTIYGYQVKYGTCPIFVTYHKSDEISDSTQYQDAFINEQVFHWYTRSRRNFQSREVSEILRHRDLGIDLHLFIKKEDAEGTEFYYLGPVDYQEGSAVETKMPNSKDDVVTMNLELRQATSYTLYKYLTE
ncbi:TPA: DUF3427 domain-containing protein [Streptococcus suis]